MSYSRAGNLPLPNPRYQLLSFRVPELQECCQRLGLTKSGKKAALQNRLLAYIGEPLTQNPDPGSGSYERATEAWRLETANAVIKAVFLAANPGVYNPNITMPAPNQNAPRTTPNGAARVTSPQRAAPVNKRIRCICNAAVDRGDMVQCNNCQVWQHTHCLGYNQHTNKPPESFYCEQCRAALADPFWETLDAAVIPAYRLAAAVGRPPLIDQYGVHPIQSAERSFYLNATHVEESRRHPQNFRINIACLQLDDEVTFRFHWPRNADLRINSMPYRPYGRNAGTKMGINQRDAPASVATLCLPSRNTVSLSVADSGSFVILVQRARHRSLDAVKDMMKTPDTVDQAIERVQKLVGGEEGEDDDGGLLVSHHVVSLKDPMSGQRIQQAARFSDASGLQPFDLDTYLSMVERNRKWQDPTTLKNSTVKQLEIDTYFQHVLKCTANVPEITDIEINAGGLWRPDGSNSTWFSITQAPSEVNIEVPKPDGEPSGRNNTKKSTKPGGGEAEVLVSDSETDEEEELRRAAAAVRPAAEANAAAGGLKRKREPEPEVIDLVSSDDEGPVSRPVAPPPLPSANHINSAIRKADELSVRVANQMRAAAEGHMNGNSSQHLSPLKIKLPSRPGADPAIARPQQFFRMPAEVAEQYRAQQQQQQQQQPAAIAPAARIIRQPAAAERHPNGSQPSNGGPNGSNQVFKSPKHISQEARREVEQVRSLFQHNPGLMEKELDDWLT